MKLQTLLRLGIAFSSTLVRVFSTLSPKNDPNWLTLATGSSSRVQQEEASPTAYQSSSVQAPQSHQQHLQEAIHPIQQASTRTQHNEDNVPNKKPRGRGQYLRTDKVIEKQRAYWTQEKRMEQSEVSRRMRLGKILSEESKRKIRQDKTGKIFSLETREKMRKSHLGRKLSEATKAKMRESRKRLKEQRKEKQLPSHDRGE